MRRKTMEHRVIAAAILILEALNASGTVYGVILQLSRASRHGESQQLALWSSSSLRSEASRVSSQTEASSASLNSEAFQASVENLISK